MPWCSLSACCLGLLLAGSACGAESGGPVSLPAYRVETDGFSASEADIRAVLDSAARELWRYFPDYTLEPLVVVRGRQGPITLHQRNERGEIVMRLDTERTFWCQYAYQFAHEFCHVLCGFRKGYEGNRWFEETLCETASLFALRQMSRSWKDAPPFPNWREFRDPLRDYVDDVVRKRDLIHQIYARGLPEFYRTHQATLVREPCTRELNGAMSLVFLQLFEERPERWESVRWLNTTPAVEGDSLNVYLQKWRDATPVRQQAFVQQVADLYGVPLRPQISPEPAAPASGGQQRGNAGNGPGSQRSDPERAKDHGL